MQFCRYGPSLLWAKFVWGRSDYPRIPKDTPRHPKTHLISYIIYLLIHLFIHSDENKAKMASNSFHFQVHSFEKVLLNTTEKPYRHHTDLMTYNQMKCYIIFFMFYLFSHYYYYHYHHYYYFVDRQLNVVIPAVLGYLCILYSIICSMVMLCRVRPFSIHPN